MSREQTTESDTTCPVMQEAHKKDILRPEEKINLECLSRLGDLTSS